MCRGKFLLFILISCSAEHLICTKSMITLTRLNNAGIIKNLVSVEETANSTLNAISFCRNEGLNRSICRLPDNTVVCTDLIISGKIVDLTPGEKIPCFTSRPSVIFPSASATAISSQEYGPLNNILDGVYGVHLSECFSSNVNNAFVLITFDHPVKDIVVILAIPTLIFTLFMLNNL